LRLYLAASLLCFVVAGLKLDPAAVQVTDVPPGSAARDATGPADGRPAPDKPRAAAGSATAALDGFEVTLPDYAKPAEAALRARIRRFEALDPADRVRQLAAGMQRYAPYAMFVLVPAFALLLKLVYPHRRGRPQRPWLYGEHLVFAVHNHAFLFLAVTLAALAPAPIGATAWAWAALYPVLALRRVYGGRWIGALLRAGMLFVVYLPLVVAMVGVLIVAAVVIG
jgi:hypothetical protein